MVKLICAFVLLSVCLSGQVQGQIASESRKSSTVEIDSLKSVISKLENSVNSGSYTRIPNKDFETIIDNKIERSVQETVRWWLFIIGVIISVLSFLVTKFAINQLQNIVDEKVKLLRNENEEKIKNISAHYFSSVIDSLIDFKIETITKKDSLVDESSVDDLMTYLKDESLHVSNKKKVILIDTIMLCYYLNNYDQRLLKMINLIREYEDKYTLNVTTYANAAIAFNDMYERYGTKDYLNSAIENCNKCIRITPYYGVAFAQKIEAYIMAISKSFDEPERKTYETELLKVFKDIENNSSPYLCSEIVNRFEGDKTTYLAQYLEKLYQDYPEQMKKITERIPPNDAYAGT